MKEKYYKVKTKDYNFHAIIWENEFEYRVLFGGKKECINISIYKDGDNPNINGVSYDGECSIEGDMLSGDGTTEMLKGALKFVRQLFGDGIKDFYFKDHSKITCNKNIKIPLYYFYLSKYGKTWYGDKVNAKLLKKTHRDQLKKSIEWMKSAQMIKFEKFIKEYFDGCRIKGISDVLKPYYEKSESYLDFLKNVINDHDCGILESWFALFWGNNCGVPFGECLWKIKVKDIESWKSVVFEEVFTKPNFKKRKEGYEQDGGFYPFGKDYTGPY